MSAKVPRRGFTLVEMLVVLGIIAVLVALLMPAVMSAVNSARRAAIATEINALDAAIKSYKDKRGDFPPNFRNYDAFIRHVRKCYPKIDGLHLNNAIGVIWNDPTYTTANPPPSTAIPLVDEGESLVFWLYLVDNDPRYPFKCAQPAATTKDAVLLAATSPERIYPFKEDRLVTEDTGTTDQFPSYRALYSKDTNYIYIDHRSYTYFTAQNYPAYAENTALFTRPYWSDYEKASTDATLSYLVQFKPMQPTSFQIICAGQDGDFGGDPTTTYGLKFFKGGGNTTGPPPAGAGYMPGDRDNMTNFTEGRRLEDHIP